MSTYEISKSSLLSLKAEILRKQEELTKAKSENEIKIRNLKKNTPLELKNRNVGERMKNDIDEEQEDLLKKSRSALEAKAQLYEKLSKNNKKLTEEEREYNRRYLVRFDKKSKFGNLPPEDDEVDKYPSDEESDIPKMYSPPRNPDEEWVEYVDCLGRTRTCLRKDLEYLKSNDKDLEIIVESRKKEKGLEDDTIKTKPKSPSSEPKLSEENELLSGDMRRELLRQQWEKEEEELAKKSDVHYQDILFNEARTHGVGYYAFSKDEEERAKQQEALKKLREETRQQQTKAQEAKAKREKQLAARVKAAKNRRRARLGLPPEEDDSESQPQNEDEKEEKKVEEDLEEARKKSEEERKKHLRPWDIGKKGAKEHYEYSQEEWVDKKRRERLEEFAPPKEYSNRGSFRGKNYEMEDKAYKKRNSSREEPMKPVPIVNECSDSEEEYPRSRRSKGAEVAPPPTYEYYGPSSKSSKKKRSFDEESVDESIEAGLKYIRQEIEKKLSSKGRQDNIFLD